jgi:hypothetical protein
MSTLISLDSSGSGICVIHKFYEDCVKIKFYPENNDTGEIFYLKKNHQYYCEYLKHIRQSNLVEVAYYQEIFSTGTPGKAMHVKQCIANLNVIMKQTDSFTVNATNVNSWNESWNEVITDNGKKYYCRKSIIQEIGSYKVTVEVTIFDHSCKIHKIITKAEKLSTKLCNTDLIDTDTKPKAD